MHNKKIIGFEVYFREFLEKGITGGYEHKRWNYKDDIIVLGTYGLFVSTGDLFYRDVLLKFAEELYDANEPVGKYNLDYISSAKTDMIFKLLTGDDKYDEQFAKKLELLDTHPRTESGNFWHKDIYPHQVWLDGLYMAMPVYLTKQENEEDALKQYRNVRKYLYSEKSGLYVHAWDEKKLSEWADRENGQSPCVWLRALGWYMMSLCDIYERLSFGKAETAGLLRELSSNLLPYMDKKENMFFQITDLPEEKGNYTEVSGSAMIAYSFFKGAGLGILGEEYLVTAEKILEGIAEKYLRKENGKYVLDGICASAGLGAGPDNRTDRDGSIRYYLSEKIKPDNQHGVAACMMAYSEYLKSSEKYH